MADTSGIGVKVEIQLGLLRDTVSELKDALKAGGEKAEQVIKDSIKKVSQQWQQYQQSQQENKGADQLFGEARKALEQAAKMGFDDAKKTLKNMDEGGKGSSKK